MITRLDNLHTRFLAGVEQSCAAGRSQEHLRSFMAVIGEYAADAVFFNLSPALEGSSFKASQLARNKAARATARRVSVMVREVYAAGGLSADMTDDAEVIAVEACWSRFDELARVAWQGGAA